MYGSPFNLSAFDLWTFPIDSKYGLSCCSFSDILTLVDFMQMNVQKGQLTQCTFCTNTYCILHPPLCGV